MSVGRLLTMPAAQRARAIAELSPAVRLKLAHLASFAIRRELEKLQTYQEVLQALTAEEANHAEP